jgi:hypothetical protein
MRAIAITVVLAASATLAAAGTSATANAPGPPVGPLEIPAGHYVAEPDRCEAASTVFFYDGKRVGELVPGYPREGWTRPIGRVRVIGRGKWMLRDHEMEVQKLGPARIQRTAQDTGMPERWCPANRISASVRR